MYEGIGVVDFSTGRSRRWAEVETDWCENPFMRARSLQAKLKQQPRGLALFAKTGWGLILGKADRKRRLIPSRKFTPPARHVASLVIPVAAKDRLAFSSRIGDPPPSFTPRAFAAARAALVCVAIIARSFSASAATGAGRTGLRLNQAPPRRMARWAMRPEIKCTSRDSRSNLATGTEQCSCAIVNDSLFRKG